jgi:hypothetical protein
MTLLHAAGPLNYDQQQVCGYLLWVVGSYGLSGLIPGLHLANPLYWD